MSVDWKWFGQAGHFIAANSCRFHLHTHVGRYCVSTVGDYHPSMMRGRGDTEEPNTIGLNRFYETMVFEIRDDGETNGQEIDFVGYNDRDAANAGHAELLVKLSNVAASEASQ